MRSVYAIRGATTVENNMEDEILEATTRLLLEIKDRNRLKKDEIISVFLTMTPDLNATFPAEAARNLGWDHIPLLCSSEIGVPGALAKCIRILIHLQRQGEVEIRHVYLKRAVSLRPDWVEE